MKQPLIYLAYEKVFIFQFCLFKFYNNIVY